MITKKPPLPLFELSAEILSPSVVPHASTRITFHPLNAYRLSEDTLKIRGETNELDPTEIFLLNALLLHRPQGGINERQLDKLAAEDGIGQLRGSGNFGESLDEFGKELYESTGQLVIKRARARTPTWQLTTPFMLLHPGRHRPLDVRRRDPDDLLDNARSLAADLGAILPQLEHLAATREIRDLSNFQGEEHTTLLRALTGINTTLEKRLLKISK